MFNVFRPVSNTAKVFRVGLNFNSNVNNLVITPSYVQTRSLWTPGKRLKLTINIDSGVTIGSTSTSTPALTIKDFDNTKYKISLNNLGNIFGKGGPGGAGVASTAKAGNGVSGGTALSASNIISNITIIGNGIIGGGGGGEGADGATSSPYTYCAGASIYRCCACGFASCCNSYPCGGTSVCSNKTSGPPAGCNCPSSGTGCSVCYASTQYTNPGYSAGANGDNGVDGSGLAGADGIDTAVSNGGDGGSVGGAINGYSLVTNMFSGIIRGSLTN